ncbi:MAG: hypothetical protein AAF557_03550 [Pseudomonadota bacterium]
MSEDQTRDPDGGRPGADMSGMFEERPGGASGRKDADGQDQDGSAKGEADAKLPTPPPPLDEEAVAKHRAAKQARVKKRRDEIRRQQAAAQGRAGADNSDPDQKAARAAPQGGGKRGSALPALRPDIKPDTPALRAERVEAIRRDLVRRRRRKGGGMLVKLLLFVVVPTLAVAWFLWFQASDMYKSETTFQVRGAEAAATGPSGIFGALLGGGGGSSLFDPVAVQTYITSRDLLVRLDADHAWIAHFQDPDLDFWHRLPADASFEDAFDSYQSMVSVSYDPTEGILEMELVAADTESARRFSRAIIGYAEEMVDSLSDRIREDALRDSEQYVAEAEAEWKAAQAALAKAQELNKIFSVEGEVAQKTTLIGTLEAELLVLEAKLTNLRQVASEADPRIQRLRTQVSTKKDQIADLRASIAGGSADQETLAELNASMMSARLNVETAMLKLTSSVQQRDAARTNASRQHRYLEVVAQPSLPDRANYPKKPEMTALAFLGFLGFYIIASLTLSLIREQASI